MERGPSWEELRATSTTSAGFLGREGLVASADESRRGRGVWTWRRSGVGRGRCCARSRPSVPTRGLTESIRDYSSRLSIHSSGLCRHMGLWGVTQRLRIDVPLTKFGESRRHVWRREAWKRDTNQGCAAAWTSVTHCNELLWVRLPHT